MTVCNNNNTLFHPIIATSKSLDAAFSKCFFRAVYMKDGGCWGSEGTLLSVFRVQACSRVVGYPSLEKKMEISMLRML